VTSKKHAKDRERIVRLVRRADLVADPRGARRIYLRAAAMAKRMGELQDEVGLLLLAVRAARAIEDHRSALAIGRRAIELEPLFDAVHGSMALAEGEIAAMYEARGQFRIAIRHYQKAAECHQRAAELATSSEERGSESRLAQWTRQRIALLSKHLAERERKRRRVRREHRQGR
jgi:tetratricopeptide (TPR) repeat protein